MYDVCSTPEEKETIAILLAEIRQDSLIEMVLDFALSVIHQI